jgi:hypothetical protein
VIGPDTGISVYPRPTGTTSLSGLTITERRARASRILPMDAGALLESATKFLSAAACDRPVIGGSCALSLSKREYVPFDKLRAHICQRRGLVVSCNLRRPSLIFC